MLRSLDALAVRQLRSQPLRAVLTTFGVVLGVAIVFSVLLLVGTIRHTMDDVFDSALGKTDVVVTPKAGLLPDRAVADARATPGVRDAGGMVGAIVTRLDDRNEPVTDNNGQIMLAGYDPQRFPPYDFRMVEGRSITSGRELIVERNWAKDTGTKIGERLSVATPTGPAHLPVVGIFKFSNGLSLGGVGLAAMPLQAARNLMDQPSGWIQISVSATDRDAAADLIAQLREAMPDGSKVQTPAAVADDLKGQLDAMNIVLYFFSGVALFVGAFLILNSFNMTVLQRMRELGMLRTLGASRRKIMRIVLDEALVLAVVGTVIGLGVGIGLAAILVALMTGLGWPIGSLHVDAGSAITASVVGIVVTLGAALWPARRAGRIAPIRAILGTAGVRRTPRPVRGVIGLALMLPGMILGGDFWFGSGAEEGGPAALLGIAMTMAIFLGMALLASFVIGPVIRFLGVPFRALFPAGGRLAVDALTTNPMRTAATAVALTIGLSVVVVNASMSNSLTATVSDQIEANFARDFEIQARGHSLEDGGGPGVPTALRSRIAAMPETRAVTPVRSLYTDLPGTETQGLIVGYDPAVYGLMDKAPVRGVDREQALREVAAGGVLLGGTYADKAGLERGDTLLLDGSYGRRRARVVGVLDTISSFAGNTFQMSLRTMETVYGRTPDAQLAVKARSDAEATALQRRLDALVRQEFPNLELQSAAGAQQEVEDQISAQFNLFNGIVAIAVLVSILGVVNTLAMSVIERTREIGVLRALGASRWKVRRTMLDESLLITLAGAITGIGFGAVIGWFWMRGLDEVLPGIAFHFPTATTITVAVAAIVLGTLAAILPARRAAKLDVLEALKYE